MNKLEKFGLIFIIFFIVENYPESWVDGMIVILPIGVFLFIFGGEIMSWITAFKTVK